jgi:hypothetical protein
MLAGRKYGEDLQIVGSAAKTGEVHEDCSQAAKNATCYNLFAGGQESEEFFEGVNGR